MFGYLIELSSTYYLNSRKIIRCVYYTIIVCANFKKFPNYIEYFVGLNNNFNLTNTQFAIFTSIFY